MIKLKGFFTIVILTLSNLTFGQTWTEKDKDAVPISKKPDFSPTISKIYSINDEEVKAVLWTAPHEKNTLVTDSKATIKVPASDGKIHTYQIVQYDMMEAPLANQFPNYRTFYGLEQGNAFARIRIDYTLFGFRAVIIDRGETTFIDYYSREDLGHRIVYNKKDYPRKHEWSCTVDGPSEGGHPGNSNSGNRAGDTKFRTYRLANAATGEYSAFYGGTVAGAQAGIVTTINRVNQVYEADLGVRLILVGNNTSIVYTNSGSDPYTNNNGVTMLSENQSNVDVVIGTANYDIGHVFSTGGGGVASLAITCVASSKARGVTGSSAPTGDAYDIDYVAHEMGHQFGGNHTFNNSNTGSCSGNQNAGTAVEPGSGSTIMAYAGICGAVDIQPHSDAYFSCISLQEIAANISNDGCDVESTYGNTQPTITGLPDYTIPISTPFVLTGSAVDAENDPLTYNWEEIDAATATGTPSSTSTTAALFRSLFATTTSKRYFPSIDNIINNTNDIWEVLPSVTRTIKFRLTVRDYHVMAGCTKEDDVNVASTATAGPFVVNVLNSASAPLFEGQTFTVLWSVANTNVAPVNAVNVDIFMSYDGGNTWPVTLLAGTPNDGSADVIIPTGLTSTARIMVRGSGNIFFDINNVNFQVNSGSPTFFISLNPTTISTCNNLSAVTTVNSQALNGYSTPINLSVNNLPSGAIATFVPSTIVPGQSATLTLSNFGSNVGLFNVNVVGSNADATRTQVFALTLVAPPAVPTLTLPADGATNVSNNPTLTWSAGSSFDYQLSKTQNFTVTEVAGSVGTNTVTISTNLDGFSTYYWRVRENNSCGTSSWSAVRSFTTNACFVYAASDLPITIPLTVSNINSYKTITDKGTLNDINIVNLQGTHSYIDDLRFTLYAPSGTNRIIWNRPCNDEDNFNINFDDAAATATHPCPPTDGLSYKPTNTLSVFNTLQIKGQWRLKVDDLFADDGGSLNSWGMRMCIDNFCRLEVQNDAITGAGSLKSATECASAGDTITFASTLNNIQLDLGIQTLVINKGITIIADPSKNISVISNSTTAPTLTINAGPTVKIEGLKIYGSQFSTAGIMNQGSLTLKNVEVNKNPVYAPVRLISNEGAGTISLEGNCLMHNF